MNKPLKWAVVLFLAVMLVLALILFSNPLSEHLGQTGWKLPVGTREPAVAIGVNHGVILKLLKTATALEHCSGAIFVSAFEVAVAARLAG